MRPGEEFFNLYNHNFARVAVAVPRVRVADPEYNAAETVLLMHDAAKTDSVLVVFPELGLSAYSCDDLFHQKALLDACLEGVRQVVDASAAHQLVCIVGAPLQVDHLLFNCAVVIQGGRILGVIPKTYLPNYREFYEQRYFAPADSAVRSEIDLLGRHGVPFGNRLLFQIPEQPLFTFHIEICEDLWVPIPPSSYAAMAGASVLVNLSASNITIGKADYRRELVTGQSARCLAAYLFTAAGPGESTTDLAWDGHAMIAENGNLLAESVRFRYEPQLITSEIDLDRLSEERMRQNSFGQAVIRERTRLQDFRSIACPVRLPRATRLLPTRNYERFPYVPSEPERRQERCREVYEIQVQGLVKRLQSTGIERVVIGISGGLDSTQGLLVSAEAMDVLGLPRTNILGYTMPGFATSARTLEQAHRLMRAIGCQAAEIDIRPTSTQMLKDIGHPAGGGAKAYDVTFENVQAGDRTSHLFRLANLHNALVVGTSDLSELALGWCTYGVGDHMSHYAVNVSVPKTLIAHVLRWVAEAEPIEAETRNTLLAILDTEFSPELVPGVAADAEPSQRTEDVIGPYELQDFHLYYTLRFGYAPPKVAFLAYCAWRDAAGGGWPDIPLDQRRQYVIGDIKRHLRTFLQRFFGFSQFKRSAIPNGPKVGSGGSLSPRGDYRAPSDSEATVWLEALDLVPDQEP
ncbi:MAG TPA: NAD(+) synthase [Bryobacteraceae bacterium]|nr:NAD(+) synthase [Bryobacteraceae bacterium]